MKTLQVFVLLAFVGWVACPVDAAVVATGPGSNLALPTIGGAGLAAGEWKSGRPSSKSWLGVQLSEVSDAVAAQLDTGGAGVMVVNVVKNSPADKAGMKRYDVIVEIDGRKVDGDVQAAGKLIGDYEPGDRITVEVLRDGKLKALDVELGEREKKSEWAYEFSPEAMHQEDLSLRGRILKKDDDGRWRLEDLGDLEELKDLPEEIRKYIPDHKSFRSHIWIDNDRHKVTIEAKIDGLTIVIEQEGDGGITVRRTDEDGNTTERVYANRDELAAEDEEAADLLDRTSIQFFFPGAGVSLHLDSDEWHGKLDEWREGLDDQLRAAQEAVEQAVEGMKGWDKDEDVFKFHDRDRLRDLFKGLGHFDPAQKYILQMRKPNYSFHVDTDGSIEVRIRKGDSEIVRTFRDEDDLARRSPELYKKYADVEKES